MTTDKRHQKQAQEKEPLGYASLQSYDSQRPAWFKWRGNSDVTNAGYLAQIRLDNAGFSHLL